MLDKLHNILNGFKNYIFEDKAVESLAKARALECAKCPKAVWGMIPMMFEDEIEEIKGLKCDWCECPLSTKLRSVDEKCPMDKWGNKGVLNYISDIPPSDDTEDKRKWTI